MPRPRRPASPQQADRHPYLIVALAVKNTPADVVAGDVGLDQTHLCGALVQLGADTLAVWVGLRLRGDPACGEGKPRALWCRGGLHPWPRYLGQRVLGKAVAAPALAYESVPFTSAVVEANLESAMRAALRKERSRPADRAVEASGALGTVEGGSLTPSPDSAAQRNSEGLRYMQG
jgi:hypothetical protein